MNALILALLTIVGTGSERTLELAEMRVMAATVTPSLLSPLKGIEPGGENSVDELMASILCDPEVVWNVSRASSAAESRMRAGISTIVIREGKSFVVRFDDYDLKISGPFDAPDDGAFLAARLGFAGAEKSIAFDGVLDERKWELLVVLGAIGKEQVSITEVVEALPLESGLSPAEVPLLLDSAPEWVTLLRRRPEAIYEVKCLIAAKTLSLPLETIAVRRQTTEGVGEAMIFHSSEHGTVAVQGNRLIGLGSPRAAAAAELLKNAPAISPELPVSLAGDEVVREMESGSFRTSLATSTRDAFGGGRIDTWRIDGVVEYQDTTGSGKIDFVKIDDHGAGEWTRAYLEIDGEWQPTNIVDVFLEVEFKLPWARSAYRPHEVRVLFNDREIARMEEVIPEGYFRFPLRPQEVRLPDAGGGRNDVYLVTRHLRGGHYVVSNNFNLHFHLIQVSRHVIASNEEEALRLILDKGHLETEGVDAALYANEWELSTDRPDAGKPVELKGIIRNLGDDPLEGARLVLSENGQEIVLLDMPVIQPGDLTGQALTWEPQAGERRYELSVVSEDDLRPANNSIPIIVHCGGDKVPPELSITSPADADELPAGEISLNGTVSDDSELEKVEFNVDGGLWKEAKVDGDRWSASHPFPIGKHSVRIRAVDRSGNTKEAKLQLTVR